MRLVKKSPDKSDVDAIRKILMSEWDPIGCGVPDDEYDSYIPRIYRLIQEGNTVDQLAAYLYKLETISMGLQGGEKVMEMDRQVAKSLLALGHRGSEKYRC